MSTVNQQTVINEVTVILQQTFPELRFEISNHVTRRGTTVIDIRNDGDISSIHDELDILEKTHNVIITDLALVAWSPL